MSSQQTGFMKGFFLFKFTKSVILSFSVMFAKSLNGLLAMPYYIKHIDSLSFSNTNTVVFI